jgi:glutamate formiminotransferase / 5-formyltetrahydrofolate cyclo-ligase
MSKLVECVPNFSEGRDPQKLQRIAEAIRRVAGVTLVDQSADKDHNRAVFTFGGEPVAVQAAAIACYDVAAEVIDMRTHKGEHPRMGAVDVCPFIPIRGVTMAECTELARSVGQAVAAKHRLPVFLYNKSASAPNRENLPDIRKGEYEGMAEKLKLPAWQPDFGPAELNPNMGVTAIGARTFLIAINVLLDTREIAIPKAIARAVRHSSGGLRYVQAMEVDMAQRGITQVSMNVTDFTKTALYRPFEMVKMEAKRYGVKVIGSEVVGLVPARALAESADYYEGKAVIRPEDHVYTAEEITHIARAAAEKMRIENFTASQVLESVLK